MSVGAVFGPIQIPADEARRTADAVLRRREFDGARPGLVRRVVEWIGDRILELLDGAAPDAPTGSGTGSFVIGWIVIALALALIGWLLWKVMPRSWNRRRTAEEPDVQRTESRRTSREEWLARARAAEAEGDHREAVHARYRALVAGLLDRNEVTDAKGATSGEYRASFQATPVRRNPFEVASDLFEDVRYGGQAAAATDSTRMEDADDAVLDGSRPLKSAR